MSAVLSLALAVRTARAADLGGRLDGGTLAIYSAPRPADPQTAPGSAVLLCVFELSAPSGAAAAGAWTADPLPEAAVILATETAAWARFCAADGSAVADGSVGAPGSGSAVELATTALSAGSQAIPTAIGIVEG